MENLHSNYFSAGYAPWEEDNLDARPDGKYEVFDNGPEFFNDLVGVIENAREFVLIKAFIWRNDEVGNRIADALVDAADRGVKVVILKDRIGAFLEYGEEDGQSFFHDTPTKEPQFGAHSVRTIYRQGRAISFFYSNEALPAAPNPNKSRLVDHPNVTAVHEYKLYDHSKVVVVDGEVSYIGGVGFGDDFGDHGEKTWTDFTLKINSEEESGKLMETIAGLSLEESDQLKFLTNCSTANEGSSLHREILEFIRGTRERLFIEMAFLGHPDFINEITEVVRRRIPVTLILPQRATSNHFRNMHFIKRLRRQCAEYEDYLDVKLLPQMVHSKVLMRDGEQVLFGSYNLHNDENVFEECNIATDDPELVATFEQKFARHEAMSTRLEKLPHWLQIIIQSRLEFAGVKAQKYILSHWWKRPRAVSEARELCRELVAGLMSTQH